MPEPLGFCWSTASNAHSYYVYIAAIVIFCVDPVVPLRGLPVWWRHLTELLSCFMSIISHKIKFPTNDLIKESIESQCQPHNLTWTSFITSLWTTWTSVLLPTLKYNVVTLRGSIYFTVQHQTYYIPTRYKKHKNGSDVVPALKEVII